jgi:catechol 2,3-dioxygenase-like lactoylglutathione lyase family enzyme
MIITGAIPTIYVSNMDVAVRFYTEALGLKLLERYGNHWASVDGGQGLAIGLHPASAENPAGRVGSMTIGFRTSAPIDETVATLKGRGVVFRGDIVDDKQVFIAHFEDPDGNRLYLAEVKRSAGTDSKEHAAAGKA